MSEEQLGQVISGSNKKYEVKWNNSSKDVYVKASGGGWERVPGNKPRNSTEALNIAAAFVRNK